VHLRVVCLCGRGVVPKSEQKKFLAVIDQLNKGKFELEDALIDEDQAEKEGVDPETVHTHTDLPMLDPYPTVCDTRFASLYYAPVCLVFQTIGFYLGATDAF